MESLRQEFPSLTTFLTLSPIPGFRTRAKSQYVEPDAITNEGDIKLINLLEENLEEETLKSFVADNECVRALAAKYLVSTRSPRGGATDPVSRFHLGNGAYLETFT